MLNAFTSKSIIVAILLTLLAATSLAQSPNTASMIVTVVDQNDAVVRSASVSVVNTATGAAREALSDDQGKATFAGLPLTGQYNVSVVLTGFSPEDVSGLTLRASETATVKIKLLATGGKNEVTVFGTTEGVRADPQIGLPLESERINETPILGRKVSTLPLLNSAFRQGKGTGDLFVNQTYFITGVGSRRATTFLVDGASNDEGWGRQTAVATVPMGAVQEFNVLTNAFSSEFGWTYGPALNIITKSGTNEFHGEGLYMLRPGGRWQAKSFSTEGFCPPSISTCVPPANLVAINPVDVPDKLNQFSGSIGGPIVEDKTFFFVSSDYTRQDRTTFLSSALPAFVLPPDGRLDVTGHYRQTLFDGRVDHRFTSKETLMFRFNLDRMSDDNPQDAVGGTNAPSVARRYSRRAWTMQTNLTSILTPSLLNEARFAYLHGDPVTLWEVQNPSTVYTRSGAVPFTVGESRFSNLWSHQFQFADTVSWSLRKHYLRIGGSVIRHRSGGSGNEPGQVTLGTFTFRSATTAPLNQLTLADVQTYSQPINFGISSYDLPQWLLTGFVQDSFRVSNNFTLDLGLRYDRQTLTDDKNDWQPRIGFGWHPGGDARTAIRGGYGMYYAQVRTNAVAGFLVNGLDGLASYTATNPTQTGFPTCLTCVPVNVDPRTIPAIQLPARDITIRAGRRDFYRDQFARFGLNFDLLPNYPDRLLNPRSQVFTIGAEREFTEGLFFGADYVHQHLSDIQRTIDLNAPSVFERTAPGQVRTVAAANLTRPILPVNGGVRQVNVIMNLGVADYNALQTNFVYRGHRKMFASVSYTLSKATNTTEPDGNGVNPNQSIITRLGEEERGPSVVDQRHRAVITFHYRFPWNFTAGTLGMFASARPFSATTGVDNNGDGLTNDRTVINGAVVGKSTFRGTATSEVAVFVENRIRLTERVSLLLRVEGFNIFNHGNYLGRGVTVYGDTATPAPTFGWFTGATAIGLDGHAIPAFANIDPPRMFQLHARLVF
jgi:Carboxypeptidase regulatory-like domain/TonB dependent receptor